MGGGSRLGKAACVGPRQHWAAAWQTLPGRRNFRQLTLIFAGTKRAFEPAGTTQSPAVSASADWRWTVRVGKAISAPWFRMMAAIFSSTSCLTSW